IRLWVNMSVCVCVCVCVCESVCTLLSLVVTGGIALTSCLVGESVPLSSECLSGGSRGVCRVFPAYRKFGRAPKPFSRAPTTNPERLRHQKKSAIKKKKKLSFMAQFSLIVF